MLDLVEQKIVFWGNTEFPGTATIEIQKLQQLRQTRAELLEQLKSIEGFRFYCEAQLACYRLFLDDHTEM